MRLAEGRGLEAGNFNTMLREYFEAARKLPADIGACSRASTDCPGGRNAVFCKAAKEKK